MSYGADIKAKDQYGKSALHYALDEKEVDIAEILVKSGAVKDERVVELEREWEKQELQKLASEKRVAEAEQRFLNKIAACVDEYEILGNSLPSGNLANNRTFNRWRAQEIKCQNMIINFKAEFGGSDVVCNVNESYYSYECVKKPPIQCPKHRDQSCSCAT